jgi:hypothetical protein
MVHVCLMPLCGLFRGFGVDSGRVLGNIQANCSKLRQRADYRRETCGYQ